MKSLPHFHSSHRDPLWQREVRERWRRPWTFLLLGIYAAFLAVLARVFYGSLVPQGEITFSKQGLGLGAPLFWNFVAYQTAAWIPLGILLGAPMLALERERQSLIDYALAGISSWQIVRAKWWSLAPLALVLVLAPLPVAALCFPLGGLSPLDFCSANTLCIGVALMSCSVGLATSSVHRTVSAAYMDAIKKVLTIGGFSAPLLIFTPHLPPFALFLLGIVLAAFPCYLLPQIHYEIDWVMQHLEIDAPQTPDYTRSLDEVPLRLEPLMVAYAQGSALAREPMSSPELARHMNAAEVERGRLDPPPSHLDLVLESVVARNPLAYRDVQTQLRSWRRQMFIGEPPPLFSIRVSLLVGAILGITGIAIPQSGIAFGLYVLWRLGVLMVIMQVAVLAATGFTRERAGNMMVQLQLSALSPLEIVGAKIVSPFVVGARLWGFVLLILLLASVGIGPLRLALDLVLFSLLAILGALLGTLCSISLRAVALATTITLSVLAVILFVLSAIFSPMLFPTPPVLQYWWLTPLRALLWGISADMGMTRLMIPCLLLGTILWRSCVRAWDKSAQNS